jgi:hypothetical protein
MGNFEEKKEKKEKLASPTHVSRRAFWLAAGY